MRSARGQGRRSQIDRQGPVSNHLPHVVVCECLVEGGECGFLPQQPRPHVGVAQDGLLGGLLRPQQTDELVVMAIVVIVVVIVVIVVVILVVVVMVVARGKGKPC